MAQSQPIPQSIQARCQEILHEAIKAGGYLYPQTEENLRQIVTDFILGPDTITVDQRLAIGEIIVILIKALQRQPGFNCNDSLKAK